MFDNLCKLLAEKHPEVFTQWLFGPTSDPIEILKTELSIEPIRADSVLFLGTKNRILHFEFQTEWLSKPPMPLRQLDYWVRLHRLYRLPVSQIVVVLLPPSVGTVIQSSFHLEQTRHEFTVIKMWEQDASIFLNDPVLLPFAALAKTESAEVLLNQVAQKVSEIPSEDQSQVSTYVQLMAGLKYDKEIIRRVFKEDFMRQSVIYQEILQEGEAKGKAEGEAKRRKLIQGMIQEGMAIETIARLAELSIEEIQQIQDDLI
jgi:predicted transposase/invertase (TIGR01784 family)